VALNDVDLRRDGDGYMSGNYGYGYGYGYGSNPDHYDDASDHT